MPRLAAHTDLPLDGLAGLPVVHLHGVLEVPPWSPFDLLVLTDGDQRTFWRLVVTDDGWHWHTPAGRLTGTLDPTVPFRLAVGADSAADGWRIRWNGDATRLDGAATTPPAPAVLSVGAGLRVDLLWVSAGFAGRPGPGDRVLLGRPSGTLP